MKRFLIVLACAVVFISASSFAGQDDKIDTIYLMNGTKISAKVTSISAEYVNFVNIEKSTRDRVGRKDVAKILYHNGVIQEFARAAARPAAAISWKDVRLTVNGKDVARLHKRGVLEAAVPVRAGAVRAARGEAEEQLKKKAAALQCGVVLVTGRDQKRLKGAVARYIIKGTAYGTDPLK